MAQAGGQEKGFMGKVKEQAVNLKEKAAEKFGHSDDKTSTTNSAGAPYVPDAESERRLQERVAAINSGNVPTDEAGVAGGAGIDEILSHGDTIDAPKATYSSYTGGEPQVPSQGAEDELIARRDAISSGNVPKDEAAVAGGAGIGEIYTHGDKIDAA